MARSTRTLATLAALTVLGGAQAACASIEANPRYATRIEDVLPSEQPTRDRYPAARPAPERAAPPAYEPSERLPPVRSSAIETEELPPLAQNDAPPPRRDRPPVDASDAAGPRGEPSRTPPTEDRAVPPRDADREYVVEQGDTLSGIARRFGTPVQILIELNGLTPQGTIRSGQRLLLPTSAVDRGVDPYAIGQAPRAVRPAAGVGLEGQRNASRSEPAPTRQAETRAAEPLRPPPARPREETRPVAAPTAATPPSPATTPAGSPAQRGRGKFIWPVRGDILSRFGSIATGLRNDGINIAAPAGTPVRAAAGGDVVYAGSAVPGFGNLVLIKHADGWVTAYGHLDSIRVKMRERVAQGSEIGTVGSSGGVAQPQLHFEIRYAASPTVKAAPVDPAPILP